MPPEEGSQQQTLEDGQAAAPSADESAKLLAAFKEAGIENPAQALDTIRKLRPYEKGEKLPTPIAKELEELRGKVKTFEDAKLSDAEKSQARIAELEAENGSLKGNAQQIELRYMLATEATKAQALDAADMWRHIDANAVERDKSGAVTNLAALIEDLKKAKPYLFGAAKAGSFDGGARGTAPAGQNMNDLLRQAAGH